MTMQKATPFPARANLPMRRWHDAAIGYHLLVALVFTVYLPVTLAHSFGAKPQGAGSGAGGPFVTALDTARDTAAQAFSLPG